MNRETLKTIAGLVVIGLIVVATFWYGNSQRQAQLKHESQVKQQQVAAAGTQTSPIPTVASGSTPKPTSNTAPVQSPSANSIQGGATTTPKPSSSVTSTPQTVPDTGGTGQSLPQTGSATDGLIGLGALILAVVFLRHQKKAVLSAARARR